MVESARVFPDPEGFVEQEDIKNLFTDPMTSIVLSPIFNIALECASSAIAIRGGTYSLHPALTKTIARIATDIGTNALINQESIQPIDETAAALIRQQLQQTAQNIPDPLADDPARLFMVRVQDWLNGQHAAME
jgi:hypothetical protein